MTVPIGPCGAQGKSPYDSFQIDDKGPWNKELQRKFYYESQGITLIPMSWFLALQQKTSSDKFSNREFLEQFGLIPDRDQHDKFNPAGLPVGLTRTSVEGGIDYLGFNCAFCHTGEIHYKDPATYESHIIRIDGGPSMQFYGRFMKELMETLMTVLQDPLKKEAFVSSVLPKKASNRERDRLLKAVKDTLDVLGTRAALDPLDWGFGRFDALGHSENQIFSAPDYAAHDGVRIANGPVSIPSLWGTTSYEQVLWNGWAKDSLDHAIIETLAVGADPTRLNLETIQKTVRSIPPPKWPVYFPPLDPQKVKQGNDLYDKKCLECHAPSGSGVIPIKRVNTDPTAATNFSNRNVQMGVHDPSPQPASKVLKDLIQQSKEKSQDGAKNSVTSGMTAQSNATASITANKDPAIIGYFARPLAGIWASPPYLHNGSVPNLYQLLSPHRARSTCFYVDNKEYDPVRVGFALKRCDGLSRQYDPTTGFELDTNLPGNGNSGHEYDGSPNKPFRVNTGHPDKPFKEYAPCNDLNPDKRAPGVLGCELSDDERWALIEYLKSLSADDPSRPPKDALRAASSFNKRGH